MENVIKVSVEREKVKIVLLQGNVLRVMMYGKEYDITRQESEIDIPEELKFGDMPQINL